MGGLLLVVLSARIVAAVLRTMVTAFQLLNSGIVQAQGCRQEAVRLPILNPLSCLTAKK